MILHITNLGAIKQMDINISKNFTLFCGPNGTGKTYASYVLLAFLTTNTYNHQLLKLDKIVECFRTSGEYSIERSDIETWLANTCEEVEMQLGSIFGVSEDTRNKLFGKFTLRCEYTDEDFMRTQNFQINGTASNGQSMLKITKQKGDVVVKLETDADKIAKSIESDLRLSSIINDLLRYLIFANMGSARMLTVERNSIYTFKTELSLNRNELIDRIQQNDTKSDLDLWGMVNSSSRRYPLAIRMSLRIANDLGNVQKLQSKYADIALEIERDLLHGEVSMTKDGDVEFHSDGMSKSKKLPFHLSSSIVKTMASLVVYLKHIAQEGDTLIVDEPEMNFHPDVQVLLAKIFAKLSHIGLKVVISTHSDYIIRETNNMLMAGWLCKQGKDTMAQEIGYSNLFALDADKVNVVFFEHKSKYVLPKSLSIKIYGFDVDTIDETINAQNQIAEKLYDCLTEESEE